MKEFIEIEKEYFDSNKKQLKHAIFYKTLFHIHTPASYDYCLYQRYDDKGKYYKNLSDQEMFQIATEEGLFPKLNNFNSIEDIVLDQETYASKKEFITYLLMAHSFAKNEIGIAIIADHNTFDGYEKLVKAIKSYHKTIPYEKYPYVFMGVEISCADCMHIVGIFDNKGKEDLEKWLSSITLSKELGCYQTSRQVLEDIHEHGGVGYIAHIDTKSIFKKSSDLNTESDLDNMKGVSFAYKKKLIEGQNLFIGLSNINHQEIYKAELEKFKCRSVNCFIDSDSHSIDTLDQKYFWIRGQNRNFNMLTNAFRDYDIAVRLDPPKEVKNSIQKIIINSAQNGFFAGKNSSDFNLDFSNSLNCFIGGRGSGKSTIINIINFVLGQHLPENDDVAESVLELICTHNHIVIFYRLNGDDYAVEFLSPTKEYNDDKVAKWFLDERGKYYTFDRYIIAENAIKKCIHVYKIKIDNNGVIKNEIIKIADKRFLLSQMFKASYSINDLVEKSKSKIETSKYIKERLIDDKKERLMLSNTEDLNAMLDDFENKLSELLNSTQKCLDEFNKKNDSKLQVLLNKREALYETTDVDFVSDDEEMFKGYNIRNQNLNSYLINLIEKVGIVNFIRYFNNKCYEIIENNISIYEYVVDEEERTRKPNKRDVFTEYEKDKTIEDISIVINDINKISFYNKVRSIIIRRQWKAKLEKALNDGLVFELHFNINNKEEKTLKSKDFRQVMNLSMGQKVVAMLSFILASSEFTNDITPLLIDQPEDNLDNQYIYKNLVADLRKYKDIRQVIIATHNSTIVTNAKAEKVIVMESTGKNGFIRSQGYPSEPQIIKHIINLLEGGARSFDHKSFMYYNELTEMLNSNN